MLARPIPALLTVCLVCLATVALLAWSVRKPEPEPEIRFVKPQAIMVERFGPPEAEPGRDR